MSATTTTDHGAHAEIAAAAAIILQHVNAEHDDAILFVARVLGDRPTAVTARAASLDADGVHIALDDGHTVTVLFATPATSAADVSAQLTALVHAARASARAAGIDHPVTSIEQERARLDAIKTFFTTVVRVEDLTPGLRRITFGGGDLADVRWLSPDQFFYVLLPPLGSTQMSIDRTFTWEQVRELPPDVQPRGAYYTVRHHRPEVNEIDIDVVRHGDDVPESRSASTWAAHAGPGDVAALWGPRTSWEPPADTQAYLLVADETGLPAVGAIMDHLPSDATVRVVVEVADAQEQQPLAVGPDVQVTWLHRNGAEPGTTTQLVDAVRALTDSDRWPAGQVYAWGGGETKAMTATRRHLRDHVRLARHQVSMVGYWRRGGQHDSD
jgi:NADPH-dependent ferric siderophore reductase